VNEGVLVAHDAWVPQPLQHFALLLRRAALLLRHVVDANFLHHVQRAVVYATHTVHRPKRSFAQKLSAHTDEQRYEV